MTRALEEWTREERLAIGRLRRALAGLPRSVRLYVTDCSVIACKQGVSSYDLSEGVGGSVHCGCILTDLHDDDDIAMGRKP